MQKKILAGFSVIATMAVLACLSLFWQGCSPYARLSTYNFDYQYTEKTTLRMYTNWQRLPDVNMLRVHVAVKAYKVTREMPVATLGIKYRFTYRLTSSYSSKDNLGYDTLDIAQPQFELARDHYGLYHFSFDVARPKSLSPEAAGNCVLVLKAEETTDAGKLLVQDCLLAFDDKSMQSEFSVFDTRSDKPRVGHFFRAVDTVRVASLITSKPESLMLRHYDQPFLPALPAFAINAPAPKALRASHAYKITTQDDLLFNQTGLYFVQRDTNSRDGFAFIVTANKYPRVTKPEDLIAPLVYITTREERAKLGSSHEPKQSLDQFWQEISGSKDHAKRVIREFYSRVELANETFSNFKEGWRTDQGMIYIVFGQPDRVVKTDGQEEWLYDRSAIYTPISFVFVRKPTIFTSDNFELLRVADYDHVWYSTVDQWRRGILKK